MDVGGMRESWIDTTDMGRAVTWIWRRLKQTTLTGEAWEANPL